MKKRKKAARERVAKSALEAREALDLTQRAFAELLGVPQSTVARWESGARDPGAVGEALFALIVEKPRVAKRVLRRLRAEAE